MGRDLRRGHLEGPPATSKTAIPTYVAWKTGTPLRRIGCSEETSVEDLLGKFIGGKKRFTRASLEERPREELVAIADELLLEHDRLDQDALIDAIVTADRKPRFVYGPLALAAMRGEISVIDEADLAPEGVQEAVLHSLYDDRGNLRLPNGELIEAHPMHRCYLTMNGTTHESRNRLSRATLRRFFGISVRPYTTEELAEILTMKYGAKIPKAQVKALVQTHSELARRADEGEIAYETGGATYSLRSLLRCAERFVRFRGADGRPDDSVMRQEIEEVYLAGLMDPEEMVVLKEDVLRLTAPYDGPDFYQNLELEIGESSYQIGNVSGRRFESDHALVPGEASEMTRTETTLKNLYLVLKALEMGENVLLLGHGGAGKTALVSQVARILGLPLWDKVIRPGVPMRELIGGFGPAGWQDGVVLQAGRTGTNAGVLNLDEYPQAASSILERLNAMLDSRRLLLLEKEGDDVRFDRERFKVIFTTNPPTPDYPGVRPLSKPNQSRFTTYHIVGPESREEQRKILAETAEHLELDMKWVNRLLDVHHAIKQKYEAGDFGVDLMPEERPLFDIGPLKKALRRMKHYAGRDPESTFVEAIKDIYTFRTTPEEERSIVEMAFEATEAR